MLETREKSPQVVSLDTPYARQPHAARVWHLIEKTYEGYGNSDDGDLYGAEIANLVNTPGSWKLALQGTTIIAGVIYRNFKGQKVRLVLHEDTRESKDAMKSILLAEFDKQACWAEASGNMERILHAHGVREIPNTEAAHILGKEIETLDEDGVHYERDVHQGTVKREMLFGYPQEA